MSRQIPYIHLVNLAHVVSVLLTVLIAMWLSYMHFLNVPDSYTPTTTLLLTDSAPGAPSFDVVTPPPVSAATYRTYILDGDVLSRVLEDRGEPLNSTAIEELRRALDVKIEEQQVSSIIRVSLTDADPERAADIVNRIARYTVTWDTERGRRSLEAGVDSLEAALDGLHERRAAEAAAGADTDTTDALIERQEQELDSARERLAELIVVPLLDVLRVVEPPTEPDPKHELSNAVIGGVAAAAVVCLDRKSVV